MIVFKTNSNFAHALNISKCWGLFY